MIADLLGEMAARDTGFRQALASEDEGRTGSVLKWARTPETPCAVRAIVEGSHPLGVQDGRFDEVIVAAAHGPAFVHGVLQAVHLRARRREGAICYRLTGSVDTALPPDSLPLEPGAVHEILCGDRKALVARSLDLLIASLEPKPLAQDASALSQARHIWMPRVTSRFYDFAGIETEVYRAVTERVMEHPRFKLTGH